EVEAVEAAGVVDGRATNRRERRQEPQIILGEAAAARPALFLAADADDADDRVAGDEWREQHLAPRLPRELRDGDGDRLARGDDLAHRRLGEQRRRIAELLEPEAVELLDLQPLVEREDEADGGIERSDRPLHDLLEQLVLRPRRAQRAPDVVERLELEELAAELEVS